MTVATSELTDSPFAQLHRVAVQAAEAGSLKLLEWRGKFQTREKSPTDFVTDADLASQQAIAAVVSQHYPHHAFLGEENPGDAHALLAQQHCWVVDPLDGTTNYVHGFPFYAVSVAVVVEGELAAGAIVDPVHQRVYSAAKGGGAWCNSERMQVSSAQAVGESLLAMSLPPQADPDSPDVLDFLAVVARCRAVRRSGSAALNLAHVARGELDAYWARAIHPWDVAAGVLLVREAGGTVSASNGTEFDLTAAHLMASTPGIHAELQELLRQSGAEPVRHGRMAH